MEQVFFWILAVPAVLFAAGVVLFKNPLVSALSLVASFFFVAALYVLLYAHMVAVMQVLVYAGAIMVLFIFVIMLLDLRSKDLGEKTNWITKIIGSLLAAGTAAAVITAIGALTLPAAAPNESFGSIEEVGRSLFTSWLFPFEVTAMLLLVAIVGAVVVAKRRI